MHPPTRHRSRLTFQKPEYAWRQLYNRKPGSIRSALLALGHEAGDLDAVDIIDDPDRQKGQKLARLNTTIAASRQRVQELVKSLDGWLHLGAERPKSTHFLRDLEAEVGGNIVSRWTLTL
jgi:hypothetical protein